MNYYDVVSTPRGVLAAVSGSTVTETEPVSLDELRAHCHVDEDAEDTNLLNLGAAARQFVEKQIPGGRSLTLKQWDYLLPRFPCGSLPLELPRPPLSGVTSVNYYDADNVATVMPTSDYTVVTPYSQPGHITPAADTVWPVTYCRPSADSVRVRFVGGFGGASTVPYEIKLAILMLTSHWNEHREAVGSVTGEVAYTVDSLLRSAGYGAYY